MSSKPAPGPGWSVSPFEWGARRDYDKWTDAWVPKDKIVIHYGGGANSAGSVNPGGPEMQIEDEKSVLRGWERYHIDGRRWRGIAYCYAVGQSGEVYRLRGWNLNGAHYGNDDLEYDGIPENREAIPVVFILGGDQRPTDKAYAAFRRLREYLEMTMGKGLYLSYHQEVARSGGHNTACPGSAYLIPYAKANRESGGPLPTPPPVLEWPSTLRKGDNNPAVRILRALLEQSGYNTFALLGKSRFGKGVDRRVRKLQTNEGLTVDGIVGRDTKTALIDNLTRGVF